MYDLTYYYVLGFWLYRHVRTVYHIGIIISTMGVRQRVT